MEHSYLLILFIDQGRHFELPTELSPAEEHLCQISISASLEGDELFTSPLNWANQSVFQEELAWRLTGIQLQQLRDAKTQIGVKAWVKHASTRYLLGTFELKVSEAKPNTIYQNDDSMVAYHCHWQKLKSSTGSNRSKLKIDLVFEKEDTQMGLDDESLTPTVQFGVLKPILDLEHGYFVLGEESEATDMFYFVYHFIMGLNLSKAIPKDIEIPANSPYHFYMDFFGADIQSKFFYNLDKTEIPNEIARVKLKTNPKDLAKYFNEVMQPLRVFLLAGDQSLAQTKIHVPSHLHVDPASIRYCPISVEGLSFFVPKATTKSRPSSASSTQEPLLGFSVELIHSDCLVDQTTDLEPEDMKPPEVIDLTEEPDLESPSQSSQGFKRKLEETVSELEFWKLNQRKKFQEHLVAAEAQHCQVLAGEWKQREEQRETIFQEKFMEISQLADKLKKALAKVEAREKALDGKEVDLAKREKLVEVMEGQATSSKKAFSLEQKAKLESLVVENSELRRQLSDSEKSNATLKISQTKVVNTSERFKALEVEIRNLEVESGYLRKENERLAQSKEAYKKAWEKAEDELKTLKSQQERKLQEELTKAKEEIAHLRRLSSQSKVSRVSQTSSLPEVSSQAHRESQVSDVESSIGTPSLVSQRRSDLTRLRANRRLLLKTGNYTQDSEAVKCLDASIAKILAETPGEGSPKPPKSGEWLPPPKL